MSMVLEFQSEALRLLLLFCLLHDFFYDRSANLELVVAIVIPNSLRQFLNLTIPNDCNLIPSGHGTRHEGAEINLKT